MEHCVECVVCKQMYDVTMNSERKYHCNKCYKKEYYEKNKQSILDQKKEYYKKNKQNKIQKVKEWQQNNEEKAKKYRKICEWKRRGLICQNYDQVYQLWLDSTHCDSCSCKYTNKNVKSMDHCHNTGKFRGIICNRCNANMLDQKRRKTNTTGHKNIAYHKCTNRYVYEKRYYSKRIQKQFKTKVDALCFKYIMLLRLKAGHYN
jgi:hypothetical protein